MRSIEVLREPAPEAGQLDGLRIGQHRSVLLRGCECHGPCASAGIGPHGGALPSGSARLDNTLTHPVVVGGHCPRHERLAETWPRVDHSDGAVLARDPSASPSHGPASITVTARSPDTGSAVNRIPDESASTMRWTTTAMLTSALSLPRRRR